jgi:hypothetical protein
MRDLCLKEKVMNIRTKDSKIFHVLINRQRRSKTSAAFPFFIADNAVLISSYVGSGISSCVVNRID